MTDRECKIQNLLLSNPVSVNSFSNEPVVRLSRQTCYRKTLGTANVDTLFRDSDPRFHRRRPTPAVHRGFHLCKLISSCNSNAPHNNANTRPFERILKDNLPKSISLVIVENEEIFAQSLKIHSSFFFLFIKRIFPINSYIYFLSYFFAISQLTSSHNKFFDKY